MSKCIIYPGDVEDGAIRYRGPSRSDIPLSELSMMARLNRLLIYNATASRQNRIDFVIDRTSSSVAHYIRITDNDWLYIGAVLHSDDLTQDQQEDLLTQFIIGERELRDEFCQDVIDVGYCGI